MNTATPDGIEDTDWDRVKELAVAIANATQDDEEGGEEETRALMGFLDELESKYGVHPSILATRADFLFDPDDAVRLLERAYALAVERKDPRNRVYIADSLASTFIRELEDVEAGGVWLQRLGEALKSAGDDADIESYEELRADLKSLTDDRK
jgi:hypothetical protein